MGWELYVIKPDYDFLPKNKMKFLVDENLNVGVTDFLRNSGWNVKNSAEVGLNQRKELKRLIFFMCMLNIGILNALIVQ